MDPIKALLFVLAIFTCIAGCILPFHMGKLPYAPSYGPFLNPKSRFQIARNFGIISIGVLITLTWACTQNYFLTGKLSTVIVILYAMSITFHYPSIQCHLSNETIFPRLNDVVYYAKRKKHFFLIDILSYTTAYFYLAVVGPYIGYIAYLLMFG